MSIKPGDAPYHAHIYFSAAERDEAARLREKLSGATGTDPLSAIQFVGDLRDHKVGPHPVAQFEVHFAASLLPDIRNELAQTGLRILLHPVTLDDTADHTSLGEWIGEPMDLDLSVLDPLGVNQGLARFGKTDF